MKTPERLGRDGLQIYDAAERRLVRVADAMISPLRWWRSSAPAAPVRRVLLLRLERIGDLLMTLDAIAEVHEVWPDAHLDLAVGAWNAPLAALIPGVSEVQVVSVPWLSRGDAADRPSSLIAKARAWRKRRYDLVVNFEPDIRSNALAWLSGAPRRVGYSSGGGGAFLTQALAYQPDRHVRDNARRLVAAAAGLPAGISRTADTRLMVPAPVRDRIRARLEGLPRPIVGIHVSGGRASKQWHAARFGEVATSLAQSHHATVVLTGGPGDRAIVDEARRAIHDARVADFVGRLEIVELAALLDELDLLVTGDTGPMHLAAAMGTPVVALFGPSDPVRYGPHGAPSRILRVDLPCSPCGQVRLPPERCRGHVPDCLDGIETRRVLAAAGELLTP